jgi:sugar phosphate isomerase/epimerase
MMQSSRRKFIKTSTVFAAGAALMPKDLFSSPKKVQRLGLQLYTVRDAMHSDPAGTLKKLADIGYKDLEHAGYGDRKFYGYSVKEFKKILDDNALNMISGHVTFLKKHWDAAKGDFTDEWKYAVSDAVDLEQRYIISPGLDDDLKTNVDAFKAFMDVFNKCGEFCKKSGLQFGYHNHDFEFTSMFGGTCLYDVMLNSTDPKLVAQQLDIGNMYPTGAMPLDYINKYPGRFELMHVKDQFKKPDGKYENTMLGKGVLPLKDILKAARKTGGTSQFIIEQEEYQGVDPVVCSKLDKQQMNKWGY